jgi:hypothetical protein
VPILASLLFRYLGHFAVIDGGEFGLLPLALCACVGCVLADGQPYELAADVPRDVIGAFGMQLFFAVDHNDVRLDAIL